MLGLSIRSLLLALFSMMALFVAGQSYVGLHAVSAVNSSVIEISGN